MSYDNIVSQMRAESRRLLDRPVITRGQRLVAAALLSDAADALEKQAQLVDRLADECKAWMNGVADAVEPLGYDRVAACGPSDLLPGLTTLLEKATEGAILKRANRGLTVKSPRAAGTLDSEGVCVRCGAPEPHCQCEAPSEDGHWWVAPSVGANNTEWTICHKCGNVKRQDGKPSSTCLGPVRVGLRVNPFDEHTQMWGDEIGGSSGCGECGGSLIPIGNSSRCDDCGTVHGAPTSLPPISPATLDELREWYDNNGRELR